jgi:hypothetical protein
VSNSDFDEHLAAELKSSLNQVVALLREHGEQLWLSWAERCQRELNANDSAAFGRILGAFGGMGSFNDLLILAWNGHLIQPEQEAVVDNNMPNQDHDPRLTLKPSVATRHEVVTEARE